MQLFPTPVITFGNVAQPPEDQARAAIIPVPLEDTVSYGHGASLGPAAIMAASANMELYDEGLDLDVIDFGILTRPAVAVHGGVARVLARVREAVAFELAAGRLPVVLGGEHTVTLGALEAVKEKYGPCFTVVVLDAHLDLRDEYEGNRLSHACVMRRALELGLPVRHMGSRSVSREEMDFLREAGIEPLWAADAHTDPNWLTRALAGLDGPIYLSLDVDGLDAAAMPATGTPEPGGLTYFQTVTWLAALCRGRQVLGLDLVELSPLEGQTAWDFTAARLLYRAMGLILREAR
ncbi:MAG: agmatinase [Deltaproteobacteria bacterium]|nr:agmatinase [Deltaproteobacteria bacterium]